MKTYTEYINESQRFLRSIKSTDNIASDSMDMDEVLYRLNELDKEMHVFFQNISDNMFYNIIVDNTSRSSSIAVVYKQFCKSEGEFESKYGAWEVEDLTTTFINNKEPMLLYGDLRDIYKKDFDNLKQFKIIEIADDGVIKFTIID